MVLKTAEAIRFLEYDKKFTGITSIIYNISDYCDRDFYFERNFGEQLFPFWPARIQLWYHQTHIYICISLCRAERLIIWYISLTEKHPPSCVWLVTSFSVYKFYPAQGSFRRCVSVTILHSIQLVSILFLSGGQSGQSSEVRFPEQTLESWMGRGGIGTWY